MSDQEPSWDLSLEIEGLSLRLRGLRLSRSNQEQGTRSLSPSSLSGFSVVSPSSSTRVQQADPPAASASLPLRRAQTGGLTQPIATPALPVASSSTSVVPEYPLQGEASSSRFARRQLLAASFAPIPDHLLGLCRQLSTGSLTPEQRARRAWLAGQWAKAVLDGQVDRPDPTETLDLSSRFYCVLRAEGLTAPVVCGSLSAFRRVVGPHLGRSVTHGFPSTSECRVYFAAASLAFPSTIVR